MEGSKRCKVQSSGFLRTTHYPLPPTHCPLPTTHCPLPTTHCPLPTTHYPLPTAHCPLPTTHCPLPTANCPLLTIHSPLSRNPVSANYYHRSRPCRIGRPRRRPGDAGTRGGLCRATRRHRQFDQSSRL